MTDFDDPVMLLPDILDLHAHHRPDKSALVCGDDVLDWGAFGRAVAQRAAALLALGVRPGDTIGLLADPGIDGIVATFAIMRAGAVVASLSGMVVAEALIKMIHDSGASVLIVSPRFVSDIDRMRSEISSIAPDAFIVLGPAVPCWRAAGTLPGPDTLPAHWPGRVGRDDLCIIYSSGTTSTPKGIVLSHACRLANAQTLALEMRYDERAVVLVTTALYSNTAWSLLTTAVLVGGTTVVMARFDAVEFCAVVVHRGITHTTMVPAQFQMIREMPREDSADFRSLRTACSVGSVMPEPLKRWAMKRFPGAFFEIYGLTEGLVTILKPEDLPAGIGTVGRPMLGNDLRVLDHADRETAPGEPGELVGYGPMLMTRYHRNPAATAGTMWRNPADGRSFLRSGDIGFFDRNGYFHLIDRKKDMIISGGINVYPADLEQVLTGHPYVREVSVIGVPHPKWGETPLAVVVAAGDACDPEAVREWANARLGKHQRLMSVVLRTDLPRNAGGKVLKRLLMAEFARQ
jgi:long-chain acyl-CoA synthetase